MKYNVFEKMIGSLKSFSETASALHSAGIDIYNVSDDLQTAITHLIGSIYGREGADTISWWCYEKEWGARTDLTMTDAEGNPLCETLEELHAYLEENKVDDYELPIPMTAEERIEMLKKIFE